MKRKTNKKLLLMLALTVALAFSFSIVSFATVSIPDPVYAADMVALTNDYTMEQHQTFISDLSISSSSSQRIIIVYRVVSYEKIFELLDCDEFYNSELNACRFLGFDPNVNNFYANFIYGAGYYTNFAEIHSLINSFGAKMRDFKEIKSVNLVYSYENSLLKEENENLTFENAQLSEANKTLRDKNEILNSTLDELESDNDLLYIENDTLKNENEALINDNNSLREERDFFEETSNGWENQAITYINEYNRVSEELKTIGNINYTKGYNDGMNESDVLEKGLVTVFSSPMYIFGEMFNFEIFGINILSIVQFLITISIVGIVVSKIRG